MTSAAVRCTFERGMNHDNSNGDTHVILLWARGEECPFGGWPCHLCWRGMSILFARIVLRKIMWIAFSVPMLFISGQPGSMGGVGWNFRCTFFVAG